MRRTCLYSLEMAPIRSCPLRSFPRWVLSYDGVVFTDGETQVVYYNQLDERWKDLPYGTDNIGGYACGPTSMSIVVSSLTSETIDPPHMAQWAL